ncbi:hypothetical protein [Polaribacter porphyrae]|uniref:Uncharacterized protein n=1 Tax=Polaribacter porphyrae TaxID=1137780 RepID=A0A2S7WSG6_9FLAO|nr:hypothetical protein [Polaribacter porphyrae]PQJ80406.1 hypothetical protein BTO18_15040 [Polaribacter porphyrae]
MSTNQQNNNEEEVDLGSLFKIIGKGFTNFFNFIGSIFKSIFDFFILILIFLKSNAIKIVIAGLVGLVAGIFLETTKPTTYESELLVEPNFKSTRQLYDNVNFYNDLVKQRDILGLQRVFNLDSAYASSLKSFKIGPVKLDNDIIVAYDELILEIDTLTIRSYEYEDFKNSFTEFDYKIHRIIVEAEKNDVFDKLDDVIISSIVNNKYFSRLKELTNENLNRTDSLYRQNLSQLDSLRNVYMQVMLDEAKKLSNGTNIDLGGEKRTTKELELFETNRKINNDLKRIAEDKSEKYEVINIISEFSPVGKKIQGVTKNYAFLLALLSAGLMIAFLLLVKLNKFLDNYNK